MLTNSNIKQGDCVKKTVPVTPDKWLTGDLGPSEADVWLFNLPGINRQFIANERGAIFEFDSSGNKIQELKPTYDGSDTIVKYLLYE